MATTTYSLTTASPATLVNLTTSGAQAHPTLVRAGAGAAIFYRDDSVAGGRLLARLVDANGQPQGAEIVVATGVADADIEASVLKNGQIVVTWQDNAATSAVHARVLAADLTPAGGVLDVGTAGLPTRDPDVAGLSNGEFILAYDVTHAGGDRDVYFQRFSALGERIDAPFAVAVGVDDDSHPSVAASLGAATPEFSIAFERSQNNGALIFPYRAGMYYNGYSVSFHAAESIDGNGVANRDIDYVAGLNSIYAASFPISFFDAVYLDSEWSNGASLDVSLNTYDPFNSYYDVSLQRLTNSGGPHLRVHADAIAGLDPTLGYFVNQVAAVSYDQASGGLLLAIGNDHHSSFMLRDLPVNAVAGFVEGRPLFLSGGDLLIAETNASATVGGDGSSSAIDVAHLQMTGLTIGDESSETIRLPAVNNIVYGNGGNDNITTGGGHDVIFGGAGDDYIDGGGGGDTLVGGLGNDNYIYRGTDDVIIENAGEGFDQLQSVYSTLVYIPANVELAQVLALNGPTTVIGNGGGEVIQANAVAGLSFAIYAGGGNDYVTSGSGASTLVGGSGDDWLIVSPYAVGPYAAYLVGDDGNDVLVGPGIGSSLYGGAGDDYLVAGGVLDGGAGNDSLWGGLAADYIVGGEGADLLVASFSQDYLFGGAGDDVLYAGYDVDYIFGGAGNDFIWTDDPSQLPLGDYVYVGGGTGIDTIADFAATSVWTHDTLVVSPASGLTSFAAVMQHATQVGVYTVVDLGQGDAVWLYNVTVSALTPDDFLFF